MADLSAFKLRTDITAILKSADLSTLSGKKVRKQLEEKYEEDLTDKKKEIDELVMEILDEIQKSRAEPDSDNESAGDSSASEELEEDKEPPLKKKKKTPAKDNSEKDGSDSEPLDDEKLAQQLQDEMNSTGRRTRGSRTPQAKSWKKKEKKDPATKKPPKLSYLSPKLAAIVGSNKMARSDVVKKMWEIIKERDLQDPKARHFMICDDELMTVFGKKRVRTFGMMKYLSNHIFRSEEDFENSTC